MSQGIRVGLQVVLAAVIVVLAYILYISITEPYEAVERRKELTEQTRTRMNHIRAGLIHYQRSQGRFPGSLDSLVTYIRTDSLVSPNPDSALNVVGLYLDSLVYSPRSSMPFQYTLNDTSRVMIYLLEDPDSDDSIGSLEPDVTLLNASSWE